MKNVGTLDRALRVIAGLILLALSFVGPQIWWLGVIGAVLLVTGLISWCPAYRLFNIKTLRHSA
jgi:hypothetical protein